MREALEPIIAKVWRHCLATGIRRRTLTLKVKFADFQQTFSISPEASPSAAPSTVARTLSI
jgi:nucleotidyltransferase/DNA polymerase involved in DNA repair